MNERTRDGLIGAGAVLVVVLLLALHGCGGAGGARARHRCPSGGPVRAFAAPRSGRVVRAATFTLRSGKVTVGDGDGFASDSKPQRIARANTRAAFYLVLGNPGGRPIFGQVVVDPSSPPVRWVAARGLGFGTDGGVGAMGASEAVADLQPYAQDTQRFFDAWLHEKPEPVCLAVQSPRGGDVVVFDDGFGDGGFPAYSGYDKSGRLVAVTLKLGARTWSEGGFPGTPPAGVPVTS